MGEEEKCPFRLYIYVPTGVSVSGAFFCLAADKNSKNLGYFSH